VVLSVGMELKFGEIVRCFIHGHAKFKTERCQRHSGRHVISRLPREESRPGCLKSKSKLSPISGVEQGVAGVARRM
jgi:hypothetical protein